MTRTGLGKGLSSLIPQNFDESLLVDTSERIQHILIGSIVPNPDQPRTIFDQNNLDELAESIRQHGVVQPLILSPKGNDYMIVAGERRWRAAQIAGLIKVPAIVRTIADLETLEIAIIENVQRVDLSSLEQAISIEKLHQQFNLNYADIAKKLGKATSTVNNIVRLLQLPTEAKLALKEYKISEGHARQILALKDVELQKQLLDQIIKNDWTVRQAEQYVVMIKRADKSHSKNENIIKQRMVTETTETKRLAKKLNTAVRIKRMAHGGKLEIRFKDDEELNKLLDELDSHEA